MKRVASFLAAFTFTTSAAHAVPSARLVYLRGKGTESCPSEGAVRHAVERRLGYDPFSSYAPSTMFAEVTAGEHESFTASLKLVDADNSVRGDRKLQVRGACSELMDAMALTISIAIDPMSATRNGRPDDAPPLEKSVEPLTQPEESPPNEQEPDQAQTSAAPKERPMFFVGAAPITSLGAAPAVALGGGVFADARLGHLQGGIEARANLPASASAGPLGRVSSSLIAGSIFAGRREGPLFAGLIGSVGRLSATSSDVATSRDTSALYLGAGLRIGVAYPLTEAVELRLRTDVLANILRHDLEISGRTAYTYPVASVSIGAGVGIRFR
jgi:hypothetical protein